MKDAIAILEQEIKILAHESVHKQMSIDPSAITGEDAMAYHIEMSMNIVRLETLGFLLEQFNRLNTCEDDNCMVCQAITEDTTAIKDGLKKGHGNHKTVEGGGEWSHLYA